MAEQTLKIVRDYFDVVPSSDANYIVNQDGLLFSNQISFKDSIEKRPTTDGSTYLELQGDVADGHSIFFSVDSSDIFPSSIELTMYCSGADIDSITVSYNEGDDLLWSPNGGGGPVSNFSVGEDWTLGRSRTRVAKFVGNNPQQYSATKLGNHLGQFRIDIAPTGDNVGFKIVELELKILGPTWDNHSDVPGAETTIYYPVKTTSNSSTWLSGSGTPLDSNGNFSSINQGLGISTTDKEYIRHVDTGKIIANDIAGLVIPSGAINLHFNVTDRDTYDKVSRAKLRLRLCTEPWNSGTTYLSDSFANTTSLGPIDNYLGGSGTPSWLGSNWISEASSGIMYRGGAGSPEPVLLEAAKPDFRAIADIESGELTQFHGLIFRADSTADANNVDQSYTVVWKDSTKEVLLRNRTASYATLDSATISSSIVQGDIVRVEALVDGSSIKAVVSTPSGEVFYLNAFDATHNDHTQVGLFSDSTGIGNSARAHNIRIFNSNDYRNLSFQTLQVHGFNEQIERVEGWGNPDFDSPPTNPRNGWVNYGAFDSISNSGFITYEVDLNFIEPLQGYDNGTFDLKSPFFKTVEAFQNLQLGIVGPPSGLMISGAELELDFPSTSTTTLFIPGQVENCPYSVFPNSGEMEGNHHYRGNFPISGLFSDYYLMQESGGSRINSVITPSTDYADFTDSVTGIRDFTTWNYYEDGPHSNGNSDNFQNSIYLGDRLIGGPIQYLDFEDRANVIDDFTYYFQIAVSGNFPVEREQRLLWRGTLVPDTSEVEIKITDIGRLSCIMKDVSFGNDVEANGFLLQPDFQNNIQTFLVSHRTTGSSGNIELYDFSTNESLPVRIGSSEYFTRQKLAGSVVTHLGGGPSSFWIKQPPFAVIRSFEGFLCEFGIAPTGYESGSQKWQDWAKSYRQVGEYLKQDPTGASDSTALTWSLRNPITKEASWNATVSLPNPLSDDVDVGGIPFELGPIQAAYDNLYINPSAIFLEIDYELTTNHPSGMGLTTDVNFNSGSTTKFKAWQGLTTLPSGVRQTVTIGHDSDLGFDRPLMWTDVSANSPWLDLQTNFPSYSPGYHADLKIYSAKIFFDSWCVPGTGNDNLPLFVNGTFPKARGNIDLFLFNNIEPEEMDLFIHGHLDINDDGTPLFIAGDTTTSTMDLFIHGWDTASGDIPLYISASESINNIVPDPSGVVLFVDGVLKENKTITLFTEGLDPPGASGDTLLWIWGTTNPTSSKNTTLFMGPSPGFPIPDHALNLFIGVGTGDADASMNLFLGNDNVPVVDMPLFLQNAYTKSSGDIPLFIGRPLNADGSQTLTDTMNLFIARDSEAVAKQTTLYLKTAEAVTDNIGLYVFGASGENVSMSLFTSGIGNLNETINLYSHGH